MNINKPCHKVFYIREKKGNVPFFLLPPHFLPFPSPCFRCIASRCVLLGAFGYAFKEIIVTKLQGGGKRKMTKCLKCGKKMGYFKKYYHVSDGIICVECYKMKMDLRSEEEKRD